MILEKHNGKLRIFMHKHFSVQYFTSHYVHCVFYVRRVSAGIQFCIFRGAISLSYAFFMNKKMTRKVRRNIEKPPKSEDFEGFWWR